MKRSNLILVVFFVANSGYGQTQTNTIQEGRIFTADGKKILFHNLTIGESSHRFQSSSKSSFQDIPADNTVRIEEQKGTEAMKWGLLCGLSGLLGSSLGVLQAQNDLNSWGYKSDKSYTAPIIGGITAASTLIGVLVGSGKKRYKTVYSNPKFNTGFWNQRISIDLALNKHAAKMLIRYRL